jgi:ADP-ribose pyrophosphatase
MKSNKKLGMEWSRYLELREERPALFVDNGLIHIVMDETVVEEFQTKNHRKIGVVYESPYHILLVDLVYQKEGEYFAYERLVPKVERGAVVMIPRHKDRIILLNQYRHAIRDYQYAFPRGFGEPGLTAEENCRKELVEEIGAKLVCSDFLGQVCPDSGVQGNMVSVFECEISDYDDNLNSEGIKEILAVSIEQLVNMLKEGKITDSFTLAALSLYNANMQ